MKRVDCFFSGFLAAFVVVFICTCFVDYSYVRIDGKKYTTNTVVFKYIISLENKCGIIINERRLDQ